MIAIMARLVIAVQDPLMIQHLLILATMYVAPAAAQQHPHPAGGRSHAANSSYAGEESREIKALSAMEQQAWLEGQGAGLAKAAELNSYPGPMHVLEHASELSLSPAQKIDTRELMERHKREVRKLGREMVQAERQLDDLFRNHQATAACVRGLTLQIGMLQAQIRASHLTTHLAQTSLLSSDQVLAYDRIRGYTR